MREKAKLWLEANYQKYFCPKESEIEVIPQPPQAAQPHTRPLASDMFLEDDEFDIPEEPLVQIVTLPPHALEVNNYLLLPQLKVGIAFDLLGWWRENSLKFPSLSKTARQYLDCFACIIWEC